MNPNSPGDSDDYEVGGLTDLNHLNNLKGGLTIKVDGKWSSELEARAANLQGKEKLTELGIEFVGGSSRDNEIMLEGFQPNVNPRYLWIEGYRGQSIPSWIDNKNYLSNLQQISISGCEACVFLGSFGGLPYLKILQISLLPNLEYIEGTTTGSSSDDMLNADADAIFDHHPNNAPSAASLFPSLEVLTLHLLPKLKGWRTMCASKSKYRCFSSAAGAIIFPRLRGLYLQSVGLEIVPEEFQGLSSLEYLQIAYCKLLKGVPEWIESLGSLKELDIHKCPQLTSSPDQMVKLSNFHFDRYRCPGEKEWFIGKRQGNGSTSSLNFHNL